MPRIFTVRTETTLQALGATLLDARFSGAQADVAMERVKALNPHVDPQKISPGTVLFVPDAPGVKATVGISPQSGPMDDFRALLSGALSEAASRQKNGNAVRAAGRADLSTVLKSAAFKRAIGDDPDIAKQVNEAQAAMTSEERADKQAEETLGVVTKSALAVLTQIRKVSG